MNLGYIFLKFIYQDIGINNVINIKQKQLKTDYSLNDIMQLLIYSRTLYPSSKLKTYIFILYIL